MMLPGHIKKLVCATLIYSMITTSAFSQTFTREFPAGRTGPGLDLNAYEIFYSIYDQSVFVGAREGEELYVVGTDRSVPITFGAEKEGSSSKIVRVMSPSQEYFAIQMLQHRALSLWFIENYINGSIRARKQVIDMNGKVVTHNVEVFEKMKKINWSKYANVNWYRADEKLKNEFKDNISLISNLFPESPFSFLTDSAKNHLWSQTYPDSKAKIFGLYDSWVPLFGNSEKYIERGHQELNKGWEVIFKPQKTYGDFEAQIKWFREIMGSKTVLFESPGHNRVVMPRVTLLPQQEKVFEGKAAELSRMLLAYVVLRGVRGNTGILGARYKDIPIDEELKNLKTGRGPLRLERDRFYKNSIGVEFRVGMKDEVVRRFAHAVYASRIATNEMQDIASIDDWKLLPPVRKRGDVIEHVMFDGDEYGVTWAELNRAIEKWRSVRKSSEHTYLKDEFLLPLWLWWNAPFAKGKQAELKRLSREFIIQLGNTSMPTYEDVNKMLIAWASASNLIADIEKYLAPKKSFDRVSSALTVQIKPGGVDVNKIDLGNEFTARMPLKLKAEYDSNGFWEQTIHDMTPDEREERIKSIAESLQESFTGSREGVVRLGKGSHGHNLVIAYELKDARSRTWRVEWDGVGRNYDVDGNILEHTARGGHIEIVSPKYNPSMEDINAVYDVMNKESLVADYKMGGSHINIDFEIFEKNPKAMARFLTIFHQNRGIISFMFQHMNRLRSAEPVEITPALEKGLQNFQGTKEDLAKLLYNERYFNSRQNRKTRYTQIDVSNYMGSVIPAEFISPDFDVVKARYTGGDGWKKQFRITKHKKLEFRLFDAAKDSLEAALQIKLVRAMLNLALNDDAPLTRGHQLVDHEAYVADPEKAYRDLRNLVGELGLNYLDYSPYVTNKLIINGAYIRSKIYKPWFSRANIEFPKTPGWGKALDQARSQKDMIYSDSPQRQPVAVRAASRCEKILIGF